MLVQKMAAPTGLHLRGLPSEEYRCMWRCVFVCTTAATVYHTSSFRVLVHIHCCVCASLCMCARIMTVILHDRMITPFSPQLRGVSQRHSSPSTAPKGAMCFHICQSPFPVGSNAPLNLLLSPPRLSACPHNLRSPANTK